VDYVMVARDSQLAESLERLSGFTPVETPSERYDLYAVDLQEVASESGTLLSSPGVHSVELSSPDTRPGRRIS
jgi:hypothetical protein